MPKKQDASEFIGVKYGKLTILRDNGIRNKHRYIVAECECGKIEEFLLRGLKTGNTKSCGCSVKGIPEKDILGKRYNLLTIVDFLGYIKGKANVLVKCDCGKIKSIFLAEIKSGNTKSCGCIKEIKNGLSRHHLHNVWIKMISRCYDRSNKDFKYYGGRGVIVCDEWRDSFMNFYNWAIERWKKGLQLDKDLLSPQKTGNLYSPNFCCFLTAKENCRNRINNVLIEYNGESKSVIEWAEIFNIPYRTLKGRLNRKWSIEKSLTEPINKINAGIYNK